MADEPRSRPLRGSDGSTPGGGSGEEGRFKFYEVMGRLHAAAVGRRLAAERGQGTVEYVGLVLLVGVLLAGVVTASGGVGDESVAKAVIGKLKDAIDNVGGATPTADGAGGGH